MVFWRALRETFSEVRNDRLVMVAASVAFYALLSIVPAISTTLTVYRVIFDPSTIIAQLGGLLSFAPPAVSELILEQANRLATQTNNQKWLAFAVAFAVSGWSANAGIKAIFSALNEVEGLEEQRGFVMLTLVTLGTTVSALVLLVLALATIAFLPAVIAFVPFAHEVNLVLLLAHWPLFLAAATFGLLVLYRIGPCWSVPAPRLKELLPGALAAAFLWVLISGAFSWYTSTLGHYSATYGSMATVVVFMTWLWLSTLAVLAGAAFNSALSRARAMNAAPRLPYRPGLPD